MGKQERSAIVNQILTTSKQLRSFAKQDASLKSHASIIASNLTMLAQEDDPDSDDHAAMRILTMRNIRGLREAVEKMKAASEN